MALPLIHINGFPAVGKLTIARKLVELLQQFDAKLVHNHLLIDPASAVLPRSSPDYQPLRRAIRDAVFNSLAESQDTWRSMYIFTDFQSDDDVGRSVMAEYRVLAERRNCTLIPITLSCSKEENLRRLVTPQRTVFSKLTDLELVKNILETDVIYQWRDEPRHMELDVTSLDVDEAARRICDHVVEACRDHGLKN